MGVLGSLIFDVVIGMLDSILLFCCLFSIYLNWFLFLYFSFPSFCLVNQTFFDIQSLFLFWLFISGTSSRWDYRLLFEILLVHAAPTWGHLRNCGLTQCRGSPLLRLESPSSLCLLLAPLQCLQVVAWLHSARSL